MFTQLDRELHFGFQKSGSLVVARSEEDMKTLEELVERGKTNGVKNLQIIGQDELRRMEPHIEEVRVDKCHPAQRHRCLRYSLHVLLF